MLTGFVCGFGGPCDCVGYHAIPCDDSRLREAVERGKYNLQYKFQTFGVVENWDLSMALLEHTFPKLKGLGDVEVVTERKTKRHLGLPEGNKTKEMCNSQNYMCALKFVLKATLCLQDFFTSNLQKVLNNFVGTPKDNISISYQLNMKNYF